MRMRVLLLAAPFLVAAAPRQGIGLQVLPDYPFAATVTKPSSQPSGPVYEPAPLPNPNVGAPSRADGGGTRISPSLFNRKDGYRGDSFSRGETAESDQNRRLLPSAGFTLSMPLDESTSPK